MGWFQGKLGIVCFHFSIRSLINEHYENNRPYWWHELEVRLLIISLSTRQLKRAGGLHSAKILLYSVDFMETEHYQASGDWAKSAEVLRQIAQKLE